jgi:hypothetical protein
VADAQLARGEAAKDGPSHGHFVLKIHFLPGHDAGGHEALGEDGVGTNIFQMRLLAETERREFVHGCFENCSHYWMFGRFVQAEMSLRVGY